jgi:hypothetical protein
MEFNVSARGVGYRLEGCDEAGNTVRRGSSVVSPGESHYFLATMRWEVEVEVLMPDGSFATGSRIEYAEWPAVAGDVSPEDLIGSTRLDGSTTTPTPGSVVEFGAGDFLVRAQLEDPASGIGRLESQAVRIATNLPSPPSKVVLQLREVPSIVVQVLGGFTDTYVRLACVPWSQVVPEASTLRNLSHWVHFSRGKASRVFSDIKPGRFLVVMLDSDGRSVLAHKDVTLGTESVFVELGIPEQVRSDYAVVWVRGPSGELIEGATLAVGYTHPRGSNNTSANAQRQADGSYRVTHIAIQEGFEAEAALFIRASHDDYGTAWSEYSRSAATEVTISFLQPSQLTVIVDGQTSLTTGQEVFVRWMFPTSPGRQNSTFNAIKTGQTFRLGPAQPTTVTVTVLLATDTGQPHRMMSSQSIRILSREVTLSPGENTLRLSMPRLATLTVRVPDAAAGSSVNIRFMQDENGERITSFTTLRAAVDSDQTAKIDLPYGTYQVSASVSGYQSAQVVLPQDSYIMLTKC